MRPSPSSRAPAPRRCCPSPPAGRTPRVPTGPRPRPAPITNRIPLPPEVVANLGITFEKARMGRLETRLRVPGRVEIAPEARYTVRAPAAGRVVLKAVRWQRVAAGEVLGELLSPELRASQESLVEAHAAIDRADVDILRARAESGPLREIAEATEAALAAARERAVAAEGGARLGARSSRRAPGVGWRRRPSCPTGSSLPASTLFAAQKDHVEAQAAALEAAGRRDDARALVPDLVMKLSVARSPGRDHGAGDRHPRAQEGHVGGGLPPAAARPRRADRALRRGARGRGPAGTRPGSASSPSRCAPRPRASSPR